MSNGIFERLFRLADEHSPLVMLFCLLLFGQAGLTCGYGAFGDVPFDLYNFPNPHSCSTRGYVLIVFDLPHIFINVLIGVCIGAVVGLVICRLAKEFSNLSGDYIYAY